jgi:hypothetical protein
MVRRNRSEQIRMRWTAAPERFLLMANKISQQAEWPG